MDLASAEGSSLTDWLVISELYTLTTALGGAPRPGHYRRGKQRQARFPHVDLRFRRNGNVLRIRNGELEGKNMDSRLVGNLGHQPVSYAGNGKHGGSVRL